MHGLHWVLDVVFREDDSRVRAGYAGENLTMIRRVAVALLRLAPGKGTTSTRRLIALLGEVRVKTGRHEFLKFLPQTDQNAGQAHPLSIARSQPNPSMTSIVTPRITR